MSSTEQQASKQQAKYWVVIPAAGSGQRMRSLTPKQYLPLNGKTILEHTLDIFLRRDDIAGVVVCVAPNDDVWPALPASSNPLVLTALGGDTRASSVINGLTALVDKVGDDDWVLVHDAARPCLSDVILQKVLNELGEHPVGGIVAIPAKDTLKRRLDSKLAQIEKTLNRELVWQAQTPQMFRYKILKSALQNGLDHNVLITDESSAVEVAGYQPLLIEGESANLKVTTPEDLAMAEFLLNQKQVN